MGPAHSEEDEAEGFILILVKKNKFFFVFFGFFVTTQMLLVRLLNEKSEILSSLERKLSSVRHSNLTNQCCLRLAVALIELSTALLSPFCRVLQTAVKIKFEHFKSLTIRAK